MISIFNLKLHSQENIIYKDLQPDERCYLSTDTIKIDINGDLLKDVSFYVIHRSGGDLTYVSPLSNSCEVACLGFLKNDSVSLNSDSLIWHSSPLNYFNLYQNTNIGKIGIKLTIENLVYYGWIKVYYVYIDWYKALYVDKYAFCTTQNYPLLWGQTEITGIDIRKNKNKIKVVTNVPGNTIIVQADDTIKNIKLLNLSGVVIKTWNNVQSPKAILNIMNLVHGTYIVQVTFSGNRTITEKVVF